MQCEEIQELIYLEAAGAADAAACAAIRDHLEKGCTDCMAIMAAAGAAAGRIPLQLPPCTPPESLKNELMKRVRKPSPTARSAHDTGNVSSPDRRRRMLIWPLVISTSLAAAMLLTTIFSLQADQALIRQRRRDMVALAELKKSFIRDSARLNGLSAEMHTAIALEKQKIVLLQAKLQAAENFQKMIGSPSLEMASLRGTAPMRSAWGRVMWNDKMKMWKLCVFNMPHLPKSKTYEVWVITSGGKKMPAGLFNTNARTQSAMVTPRVPANPHEMAEIAVTIEPASGSRQPTGSVLLAGHIG